MTAIELVDVGPRDGLQSAAVRLTPAQRAELVRGLLAAGLPRVEAVSFVHPGRVPQMAGAEDVIGALTPEERRRCCALVLNERGYERFAAAPLGGLRFTVAVSDDFQRRNAGMTRAEGMRQGASVIARAAADGVPAGAALATSFGCPFAGAVDVGEVVEVAAELVAAGASEIVFADTIGVAVPRQVRRLMIAAAGLGVPLGIHAHNTRNGGYACTLTAVEHGASIVDASLGGLGGCPFAPGASGNVATEDLLYLFEGEGVATGVDGDALLRLGRWLEGLGLTLDSAQQRVGGTPTRPAC